MRGRKKGTRDLGPRKNKSFDIKAKQKFIRHLEKHGNMGAAADHVGVSRTTVYKAMKKDERLRERVEIAKDRAVQNLEDEMEKRIYEGNEKIEYGYDPDGVEYKKKRTVEKDNNLLVRALEANDPAKYSKKTQNTNVNVEVDGNSALNKLAEFLKISLPDTPDDPDEKEVQGHVIDNPDQEDE